MSVGVLLVNIGSPASPAVADVRRYLRSFLSDPRVIDIPAALRWPLVNLIIAPFRSPKSAHAYQSIWTPRGSPLVVAATDLADALAARLQGVRVAAGMLNGPPSVEHALEQIGLVERLIVVPLFPQYASATTGGALERIYRVLASREAVPSVQVVPPFYENPAFIDAVVAIAQPQLDEFRPDTVLFSYHGLPERQIRRISPQCLTDGCCEKPAPHHAFCYRAQCMATTRALAARLGVPERVAFQSRLGRDVWLGPATDDVLAQLARDGARRVAVLAPSFVADCLETLEELAIRGQAQFRAAGGEELRLIPAVNADSRWADGLAKLLPIF